MKALLAIVLFVAVVAGAGAILLLSGFYNVSARVPHWDIVDDLIVAARDRSIAFHSRIVMAPPAADPAKGAPFYREACVHCHGAPGVSPEPFSQGLYPAPADLLSGFIQSEWNSAQLYWIIQNGIKMTGMPAFETTYDAGERDALVAFVQVLPRVSPSDYEQMAGPPGE